MKNKLPNLKTKATSLLKWGIYLAPAIVLCTLDAYGTGFDFKKAKDSSITPMNQFVDDVTPVLIFTTGLTGAFLNRQGDLLDKMLGFAKGALVGVLVVAAVKGGMSL